jgi:diguanylate cyclase (GGDEF)-like protein
MIKFQSSMRASLGLTVLIMGLLGMAMALATGEAYQRLALDNQRSSFVALAKLKVQEIIKDLSQSSIKLGLSAQAAASFRQAFTGNNPAQISAELEQHFHRGFVIHNQIKLLKIYALDKQFKVIASTTEGNSTLPANKPACSRLLTEISNRSKTDRLKPYTKLCSSSGQSVLSAIVPIGGLSIKGYLQIVIDPVANLAKTGTGLGMPLRISDAHKNILQQSSNWPATLNKNILLAEYPLNTSNGQTLFRLTIASNVTELRKQLTTTRNLIFSIAAVVMLSTILLALFLLQRTALYPIALLTEHLRLVKKDKSQLGKKVSVSGNTEIVELANDFNDMSSELSTLYRTLENMAFTDELTGMPNRVLFYDRLEQATLTASRYNTNCALMMMDLNRFKNINDTLGHHIGDQLLKTVGERLQTILRGSDTVARLGGDEFAALLPAIENDETATTVAQKIINALNEPIVVNNHSLSIGISIGLVCCPRDGDKTTLLMQRADIAMYHAKREGLGYTFYDSSMDGDTLFELTMESELRQAIDNTRFELYYQPKIDIQHNRVTGAEALIRWNHKEYGFISPDKFIPLAEQTGLIQPLTKWVLEQALSQCAAWHAENINIGVSVNLSAYSLNDINLLDNIRHALARAKIEPHWLTLELTETAIMSDANRALSTLARLNSMGVRLSVDDFGTGYSSLAYLKRFPINEIKIDKSFVIEMLHDVSDSIIVRSTIDLAHNMGMEVVAEGIESQAAWDQLAELGCNLGQGYHMCRPCPALEFETWVQESRWGLNHVA